MHHCSLIDMYDNDEFREIVESSNTYRECLRKMGYASCSGAQAKILKERIERLGIPTSHFVRTLHMTRTPENVFTSNTTADQSTVRKMYKSGNYTKYECSICGQKPVWNNKELTLILDHINGYNSDNRLENLRWVCPNCNYQLETTNGKNKNHGQHRVNKCIDCGKPISNAALRCVNCNAIHAGKIASKKPSDIDLLFKQIIADGYEKTGRKYGVSGNAVRKWCKEHGLPYRKRDIGKHTDSESVCNK